MSGKQYQAQYQEVEVKHKITPDFILDWYEKAEQIKDKDQRDALHVVVKTLSKHLGEYLTTNLKK